MKPILKYTVAGMLMLALPFVSLAQYDNSMQPTDPADTVASAQDQQMDQNESQQVAPPDNQPVSVQVFYNNLSPYGQWVYMNNYGYVWIPNAGPGFVPYSTYGHWVYTYYGWTWVSDYSWGWAPFHYGRWNYDSYYGWYWIPDVYWGPAWVSWRHYDGYYGWAPLGPGMNVSIGYYGDYGIPMTWWVFVGETYLTSRWIYRYYLPRRSCEYYYHRSTVVGGSYYDYRHHIAYASGPGRRDVESFTHQRVRVVPVRNANRPEQRYDNAHLHLYRPDVMPANRTIPRPAPTHPVRANQIPRNNVQPNNYNRGNSQPRYNRGGNPGGGRRGGGYSRPAPQHTSPARSGGFGHGGGGRGRR